MTAISRCVAAALLSVLTGLTLVPTQAPVPDPAPQEKPAPQPVVRATGYKRPPAEVRAKVYAERFRVHGHKMQALAAAATPPAAFDCVSMGWVPPIRDQGQCGSCYLVSTADAMTCAWIKAGYGKADDTFKISDQYGMDCHDFGGCNGGWGGEVVDWAVKNGFPAERYIDANGKSISDYPGYIARASTCRIKADAKMWKPMNWGYANGDQNGDNPPKTAEIKAALMQYGVLNIALDAGGAFGSYTGGVIKSLGRSINHEITLVGWDDSKNAWLVRNQWSQDWGVLGYGWLDYSCYIVDVFWINAGAPPVPPGPVPPTPPVPPVPPGPTPPSGPIKSAVITFTDGTSQALYPPVTVTYADGTSQVLYPPGTKAQSPVVNPFPAAQKAAEEARWAEQQRINDILLRAIEALQKQVLPTKTGKPENLK